MKVVAKFVLGIAAENCGSLPQIRLIISYDSTIVHYELLILLCETLYKESKMA